MDQVSTLEVRRRRAMFRAAHRGTKEMDFLLTRYADAHVSGMEEAQLAAFEAFLELPDPQLQSWLMASTAPSGDDIPDLVWVLRSFHGVS